jgi:hypothetical protein
MREKGYGVRGGGEVVVDRERQRREAVLRRSVHILSLFTFGFFEAAARGGASHVDEGALAHRVFISILGLIPSTFLDLLFFSSLSFPLPIPFLQLTKYRRSPASAPPTPVSRKTLMEHF